MGRVRMTSGIMALDDGEREGATLTGERYLNLKCMCCGILCAQHVEWRVKDELARLETTCSGCHARGTVTVRSWIVDGFAADASDEATAKAMTAATQALLMARPSSR